MSVLEDTELPKTWKHTPQSHGQNMPAPILVIGNSDSLMDPIRLTRCTTLHKVTRRKPLHCNSLRNNKLNVLNYNYPTGTKSTRRTIYKPVACRPCILLPCSLLSLLWSLSVKEPATSLGSSFARRIPVPLVDLQLELRHVQQVKLTVVVVSLKKYAAQVVHSVLIVAMECVARQVSLFACSFSTAG